VDRREAQALKKAKMDKQCFVQGIDGQANMQISIYKHT